MNIYLDKLYELLTWSKKADFLAPLLLRLYLVPIFWMAGTKKYGSFDSTVEWFGNAEWGLGLPFPLMLAFLATAAEIVGAISLLLGVGLRWMTVPLMFTMVIAITSVHLDYGWQAITDIHAPFANERVEMGAEKLSEAKEILRNHGDYDALTSSGSIVMLNNGIEFAVTYLIMLLSLFFTGGGRYVSIDYWIRRKWLSDNPQ
jgi:putative oxidoreductase